MFQKKLIYRAMMVAIPLLGTMNVQAAKPVNLNKETPAFLQTLSGSKFSTEQVIGFQEIKRSSDFKNNQHIRFQQTFKGYKVWGADGVIHVPNGGATSLKATFNKKATKGSMDGIVYQGLEQDLKANAELGLTQGQEDRAARAAIEHYKAERNANVKTSDIAIERVVYVDNDNQAHWAYHVSFFAAPDQNHKTPAKPNYIIDASTLQPFINWDEIKTDRVKAYGGGYGGNKKTGQYIYDGLEGHLSKLNIMRDGEEKSCYLQNEDVLVDKCTSFSWGQCTSSREFIYECLKTDKNHNNVYWNGDLDKVNFGYSPSNDALFNGQVIKNLYRDWYGVPVLERNGKPMRLKMVVHLPRYDNAYWDGKAMYFGDGYSYFYPLTSLGVAAHEISHGFTEQHSSLIYRGQSGGMNEAFSDMAAQAAEIYAYGKNSWEIGPEIFKDEDSALRYMKKPSKDCGSRKPGSRCSIDDASQYFNGLDVHYSSGVYNRLFYLIASSEGWTVRKAFDVMVHANSNYWTSSATFETGACGILKATKDYGYDEKGVLEALKEVKIDADKC